MRPAGFQKAVVIPAVPGIVGIQCVPSLNPGHFEAGRFSHFSAVGSSCVKPEGKPLGKNVEISVAWSRDAGKIGILVAS